MSWLVATMSTKLETIMRRARRQDVPVDIYQPRLKIPVGKGNHLIYVMEPFLFDYIFLRMLEDVDLGEVEERLRLHWITFGRRIATISQSEMDGLRALAESWTIRAGDRQDGRRFARRHKGQVVEVVNGIFGGTYGVVVAPGPGRTVTIETEFMNQQTKCTVGIDDVRIITGLN